MKRTTQWWVIAGLLSVICGCAATVEPVPSQRLAASMNAPLVAVDETPPFSPTAPAEPARPCDTGWTQRVLTEDELTDLYLNDPQMTPEEAKRILARLNIRAPYHIAEDIREHRPLKIPNDFGYYKNWSPLPAYKAELQRLPKSILVVKDLFYLGWYERGQLIGNTMVCLGVKGQETQTGVFPVLEKDPDHYSRSYKNSYGRDAWMPWSLRIYETVWIHAGDITDKFCSHGCVTLPLQEAESLFRWADAGTPVIIVESLQDVRPALKTAS